MSSQPDYEKDISALEENIVQLREMGEQHELDVREELQVLERKLARLRDERYRNLSAVERVQLARHPRRPYTLDYVQRAFSDFIELHGDRSYRDDEAVICGWARLDGRSVILESLMSIRRAGADGILTYFAKRAAGWLRERR